MHVVSDGARDASHAAVHRPLPAFLASLKGGTAEQNVVMANASIPRI